ncbi:MAG: SDR family oxidoreductase [Candidatus Lambdaproteobacteria bacterium]|nr:SDR family oxidoreductase [Candidatus Lambdaproteobacteria bacterium]
MTNREKPLAGKTALVTGSGQNIGKGIALRFAAAGANVVINGLRNRESIEQVAKEARALGVGAMAVLADIGDPGAVQRMVDQACQEFGTVDIAVSNAAQRPHQAFLEISPAEWNRVLNNNLSSSFYLARAALPGMRTKHWGRIIHISGHDGFSGRANRAHNVTCKAGLFALSKAIAIEFGPDGITANTVSPGMIHTTRDPKNYPDYEQRAQQRLQVIPVRRRGTVEDIAEACLYLASEAAGFVTGQVLHVNGGEDMY